MYLIKTKLKQIDILFFYGSIFTLTQSIKISSKLLVIALLFGILKSIFTKNFSWIQTQKRILIIHFIFLTYILIQGLIVDGTFHFFRNFEKYYAPYLIIVLLPIFYQKSKQVLNIPKVFVAGIIFTMLLIVAKSFINLQLYTRAQVLNEFKIHHIYMSMYILFSINYVSSFLIKNKQQVKYIFLKIGLLIVLSFFLFFFKSKSAILAWALLVVFYMLKTIKWNNKKTIIMIFSLGAILLFFNKFFLQIYIKAIDFRLKIWIAARELISKNFIFGYGGSQEYLILNKQHFLVGNFELLDFNLNAHNQYLTLFIKFGFIGFVLFILAFITPLIKIKSNIKKEYIGFLFIIATIMSIESIYNRHHGIVFCTIFIIYYNYLSVLDEKI